MSQIRQGTPGPPLPPPGRCTNSTRETPDVGQVEICSSATILRPSSRRVGHMLQSKVDLPELSRPTRRTMWGGGRRDFNRRRRRLRIVESTSEESREEKRGPILLFYLLRRRTRKARKGKEADGESLNRDREKERERHKHNDERDETRRDDEALFLFFSHEEEKNTRERIGGL